jgi:hypothetical protein
MSSGRRRSSSTSGVSSPSVSRPKAMQAVRQPDCSITRCISGSSTIEPAPTPENAMLSASPRRRTNHAGMNIAWHE